jgi:hypothetical protein
MVKIRTSLLRNKVKIILVLDIVIEAHIPHVLAVFIQIYGILLASAHKFFLQFVPYKFQKITIAIESMAK